MQSKPQSAVPIDSAPPESRTAFAGLPPSQNWERLDLADAPQTYVWAWFKPATAPHGLYRNNPELAAQLTMRKLLHGAGIAPAAVAAWLINGVSIPGMNGGNPY